MKISNEINAYEFLRTTTFSRAFSKTSTGTEKSSCVLMISINKQTSVGSNCVPALSASSTTISSGDSFGLYCRSDSIDVIASVIANIQAPRGISFSLSPPG